MCTEQLKLLHWNTENGGHVLGYIPGIPAYIRSWSYTCVLFTYLAHGLLFHFRLWNWVSVTCNEIALYLLLWRRYSFCNESMARLWLMFLWINGVLNTRVTVVGWPSSRLPLWPACLTALEPGSSEPGFSVSTAAYLNPTNRWVCPFVRLSPAISFLSVSKDLQQKLQTSGLG